ncbi:MAG: MFS transporter [Elusimicrobia bacterium]|nr:MFS transporter [Elusimicrobiota bacterium]
MTRLMKFPKALRSLSHRDFRLFTCGQMVSQVGTWMQSVAQAWLVLELTDSPFKLGIVSARQFGPILLFSFPTGAIADHVPKRVP